MKRAKFYLVIMCFCLATLDVYGQAVSVSDIEGTVVDSNGAVIPSAAVTVTNKGTGAVRTATADSGGYYRIAGLMPGLYTVKIESKGFAAQLTEGVTLNVGTTTTLNASLKPAGTTETVVINAGDAGLVETSRSDLGGVVDNRQLENLPLNGRSLAGLAILIPGARPTQSFDPTKNRSAAFSINGGGGRNLNTTVDGGDNKDNTVGGIVMNFSLEGVQEYKLETQRFSAASGRSEGSALNVITKSGTNQYHGSGFLFARDKTFNANDHISVVTNRPKAEYSRQQFGGSFGGPIKQDRLFFFGVFERTREESGFNVSQTVINELESARPAGARPIDFVPTPFRDNLWQVRLDGKFSDRHTGFVKWAEQTNNALNDQSGITDESSGNFTKNNLYQGTFGLNSTISPKFVNQFIFAYQYWNNVIDSETFAPFLLFPAAGVSFGTNPNIPQQSVQKKYQMRDDMFLTAGDHGFKFGGDFVAIPKLGGFFRTPPTPNLSFIDDPSIIATNTTLYPQGFATPGAVQTLTATSGDPSFDYHDTSMLGLYFQDDWKVNRRLTLNLGVRYDLDINFLPALPDNRTYLILKQINHPVASKLLGNDTNNFAPRVGFAWDLQGDGKNVIRGGYGIYYGQVFQNIPLFAQQQTNDTVFASVISLQSSGTTPQTNTDPFLRTFRYGIDPINIPPASTMLANGASGRIMNPDDEMPYTQQWNVGYSRQLGRDYVLDVDYIHILGLHEYVRHRLNPQVPGNTVTNIDGTTVNNARLLAADFVRAGMPANRLADVVSEESIGRSRYDGLNIQLRKRFSNRFTFQTSYVLSRSLAYTGATNTSASAGFAGLAVNQNRILDISELGPTSNDERHRFVFSGVFDLPLGLQFSPIVQLASSRPYTLNQGIDRNGDGINNDLFLDPATGDIVRRGSARGGFDIRLVTDPATGRSIIVPGDFVSGRTFVTDMRISKYINLGDRAKLGIFFETFNLTNHVNFGDGFQGNARTANNLFRTVTGYLGNRTAAIPPAQGGAGSPFQAQFGARFSF
jgi:carboxypeptidase family protein/TonB-dependent receptor-like protein